MRNDRYPRGGSWNAMSDKRISNKDVAQVLAEHYQKTYELTYELWSQRNRIFLILLGVIGVGTVLTFDVSGTRPLLVRWIAISLKIEADDKIQQLQNSFPFQLVQSIFTLIVFYLIVSLYHRALYVLRNYRYLGSLEREIRQRLAIGEDSQAFTRESMFYWSDRSILLRTVKYVYIILLGLLLSAFLFKRLYDDFQTGGWLLKIADLLIGSAIILYFFAYATSSISWDTQEKLADVHPDRNGENTSPDTPKPCV